MIKDKRSTLPISTNFISASLMNIPKNQQFELKLLAFIEKNLCKKQNQPNMTNTFGNFNNSISLLI